MQIRSLITGLCLIALLNGANVGENTKPRIVRETPQEKELIAYSALSTTNYLAQRGDSVDSIILKFCREYSLITKRKAFKERNEKSSRIILDRNYVLGVSTNFPYVVGYQNRPKIAPIQGVGIGENTTTNKPSEMDLLKKAIENAL